MHIHASTEPAVLTTIDGQWKLLGMIGKGSFAKGAN
jgi:hypothetical protein